MIWRGRVYARIPEAQKKAFGREREGKARRASGNKQQATMQVISESRDFGNALGSVSGLIIDPL